MKDQFHYEMTDLMLGAHEEDVACNKFERSSYTSLIEPNLPNPK